MRIPVLALIAAGSLLAQQPDEVPVFRAESNLVILNVFARGKDGKPVENLTANDFAVVEDGKPQKISVFEFQRLNAPPAAEPVTVERAPAPDAAQSQLRTRAQQIMENAKRFRDRRLIVLFFDMSSLETIDQVRALQSAEEYVRTKMAPEDVVSVMSFGTSLKTVQEFTADKDLLIAAIRKFRPGEASEFAKQGETEVDSSDTASFALDETEFNIFNTDRRLSALETAATSLLALPEKKALIYFSSGVSKTGSENESQLRSTLNAAVKSNVSFYPVDVRGLMALPPGGDASTAASGGSGLFSGSTQNKQSESFTGAQDTLDTLASETGGKALLDTNDLTEGIRLAQNDISSYYIVGYYSTNPNRDGHFRKVEVKLTGTLQAKIDYRSGYYADKEFKDFNSSEKEKQLEDALLLGDPVTDLPLALEVNHFKLSADRWFVPVAVKLPGSAVPLRKKGGAETTDFDFIGEVRNQKGAKITAVRDAIKVKLPETGVLARRSLVYDTGFTLGSGKYKIKLLVRENLTGRMGTFETSFVVPADKSAIATEPLVSSLVLASQREPITAAVGIADKRAARSQGNHPLVRDNQKLVPSVTRVFRRDQTLYVYLEVYDAGTVQQSRKPSVAATVGFYLGNKKVFESSAIRISEWLGGRGKTVPLQLQLPLKDLPPGTYSAQVNVIDEVGRKFSFQRANIVVLADAQAQGAN
ncbi:MAG TPA: VWA domain-containing protein [Bryobacteraceae bacterium]|nr:VWA domain-containing protein [Bryobacteraceae bacterium]